MSGTVKIYRLYVESGSECYVGQTALPLEGSQGRLAHHIAEAKQSYKSGHCASRQLICQYGAIHIKIECLETVSDDANPDEREAHWIQHFRPYSVNQKIPQPATLKQTTSEGKKAYMEKYREENREALRAYDAERRANKTQEDLDREAAQKRTWIAANKEHVLAHNRELLTCEKCGESYPRKSKWRHDAKHKPDVEAASAVEATVRQALRDQCLKMRDEGMTLRAIGAALVPPVTHDKVRRLLAEATPRLYGPVATTQDSDS
jgi:hypothetical protein